MTSASQPYTDEDDPVPASLRDATLVVTVDDPTWATQLRWFEADLVARLQAVVGADAVVGIEVRVARG